MIHDPVWKRISKSPPPLLAHGEFVVVEQAGLQLGEEFFLFEILAYENEHLPPVAVGVPANPS